MEKTYYPKGKIDGNWVIMDANGEGIGRLSTQIAHYLLGKHRPDFTPGVNLGDFVVVVNANLLKITGKRYDDKMYYHHSGYPGGLKETSLRDQMNNHPDRVIRAAVWGMLPHNKLGRLLIKKLKVYSGNDHPHAAQQPQSVKL